MQKKNESEQQGDRLLEEFAARRAISQRRGTLEDLRKTVLQARPYRLWVTLLAYLRRVRTVSLVLRVTGWLLTLLQTGALVLLTTLVFFILLPILLLGSLTILLVALLDTRHSLRTLRSVLSGNRVLVFFSPLGSFGAQHVLALAKDAQTVVLVVSPHWFSPACLGRSRFFVNLRRDGVRLFVIRRYFFFAVRRSLLDPNRTVLVF